MQMFEVVLQRPTSGRANPVMHRIILVVHAHGPQAAEGKAVAEYPDYPVVSVKELINDVYVARG